MAANLPALYAEAWTAPRPSMRRILSMNLSERERLMMVAITGVLFAIPVLILIRSIELPPLEDGTAVQMPSGMQIALFVMIAMAVNYFITAALIRGVGSLFGGRASYNECKTVSAWTLFVIGIANVALTILTFLLPGSLGGIFGTAFMIVSLYISSAYIAEAHGFESTGKVVLGYLGVFFVLMLVLASLIPAEMLQAQ